MIQGKTFLAIIPARGGSKGVPRKNLRLVGGKPLISWTIEAAKHSQYIDRCIISSDDLEIIRVAKEFGGEVPFVRPRSLAEDGTSSYAVVEHAIEQIPGFDYVILLQPTSPFRTAEDIDKSIELCMEKQAVSCVSVCKVEQNPLWMYQMNENLKLCPIFSEKALPTRRQELPEYFTLNGAIYITQCDWLLENKALISSDSTGYLMEWKNSLDIDTMFDFKVAEILFNDNIDNL